MILIIFSHFCKIEKNALRTDGRRDGPTDGQSLLCVDASEKECRNIYSNKEWIKKGKKKDRKKKIK